MTKSNKFSPEVRERAVRLVQECRAEYPSLWAAVESIAPKIGCAPSTLLDWVKQVEVDSGQRGGTSSSDAQRIKELEREVKELRRANDILKTASAFLMKLRCRLFLRKRSSTADSSREGLHRPSPRSLWGRAHLPCVADGPIVLLAPRCARAPPTTAQRPRPP